MRRVSIITRAAFSLSAIGSVVGAVLWTVPAGQALPQAPPSAPPAPATAPPSTEPTDSTLYAQGCARLRAGDPAAAIRLLAQAVAKHPDKLDYSLKLAKAHAAAGEIPTALRLLNDLASRYPDHIALRAALARIHALDKNWSAVEAALSPLEDELEPDVLILLAQAYAETERPRRAESVLRRGLTRLSDSETLWLALIDQSLSREQGGLALQRVRQAQHQLGPTPPLQFRAAQAYYQLGQVLGQMRVMHVPSRRVGQFFNDWLLVELSDEPDQFLCCPKASALYALRRALDAGLDEPAAHCLHARIWQRAGRPEVGLAVLQSREAVLLEDASSETLETFADLALAANALECFLRYARRRAQHEPEWRTELLADAYLAVAERYNQRGDDALHRELLRRALALRPENVGLMLRLADAVWDTGARTEAAIWYRRVLERVPTHPERTRILGRLGD